MELSKLFELHGRLLVKGHAAKDKGLTHFEVRLASLLLSHLADDVNLYTCSWKKLPSVYRYTIHFFFLLVFFVGGVQSYNKSYILRQKTTHTFSKSLYLFIISLLPGSCRS